MTDQETIARFIFLRSQGWSFNRIAVEINISKPTLIKWSRQNKFAIQNLRATETVSSWATPPGIPQVLYAGGAPALLCGVQQINLRIPDQVPLPLNAVPVMLSVQLQNSSQPFPINTTQGTTIAVK